MADTNTKGQTLSIILTAIDKFTAPLRQMQQQIDRVTAPARQVGNALASLGQAAGVDKLTSALKGTASATAGVFTELDRLAKRLALVGGAAAFGLYELIQRSVDSGAALKFQAQRLGVSVDELVSYRFAAKEAGIEQEAFTNELDFFNKTLGAVKLNTGPLFEILRNTPVALRQLQGSKSTGEALQLMLHGLGKIKDDAVRAKVETLAFGRSAGAIDGLVRLGADEIQRMREEFLALSGSQREFAEGSVIVLRAEARMQAAFEGTRNTFMVQLYPLLTEQLAKLTRALVTHRPQFEAWARTLSTVVGQFVEALPSRFERFSAIAERLRDALQPIASLVGGWPELFATVGTLIVTGPLVGALATLTKSLVALAVAANLTPIGWLGDAVVALGAAAAIVIANWEPISNFFQKLFDGVRVIFQGFLDFLQGAYRRDLTETMKGLREIANPFSFVDKLPKGNAQSDSFGPPIVNPNASNMFERYGLYQPPTLGQWLFPKLRRFFAFIDGVSPESDRSSSGQEGEVHPSSFSSNRLHPDDVAAVGRAVADARAHKSESHITVDFQGLPRGARVQVTGAPVQVSAGYASIFADA